MKAAAVFLLLLVFGLIYYYSGRQEDLYEPKARHEVPAAGPVAARPKAYDFAIQSSPKKMLSSLKGQVVYINFWASWCEPCRAEFPLIESLQNELAGQKFSAVLVNMDSEGLIAEAKELQAQLAPSGIAVYENTRPLQQILNIEALPYHIIIDREGRVAAVFYASLIKDEEKFRALLKQLLAEPSATDSSTL